MAIVSSVANAGVATAAATAAAITEVRKLFMLSSKLARVDKVVLLLDPKLAVDYEFAANQFPPNADTFLSRLKGNFIFNVTFVSFLLPTD
jgi:hypothetical protein